ncbi:MAG: cyclic nucleotide-binding domain-containing protein, partial [Bacteroidota bacterium]
MSQLSTLLSEISAEDREWWLEAGTERQVIANTILIQEGKAVKSLIVVLQGLLSVRLVGLGEKDIALLGPGELLGEMSFLEGKPASASIVARENSLVLEVSVAVLEGKLASDAGFAVRFYRAISVAQANRLRNTMGKFSFELQDLTQSMSDMQGTGG